MYKIFLAFVAIFILQVPALSAPVSTVLDGEAALTRGSRLYKAQRGVTLQEGDILNVKQRLQFILPFGAATVTKRAGLLKVLLSRREGCGVRIHMPYSGGISANARPRTCPTSSITFESLTTGAYFNPWAARRAGKLIPNTVIAQILGDALGSSFDLTDRGDTSVLSVRSGLVESQSVNVIVPVPANFGNITPKDKPPGPAIAIDSSLSAPGLRVVRVSTGIKVLASISALNTMEVQGQAYRIGDVIRFPVSGNSLRVRVVSPDGDRWRVYVLPLPARKS
jgi:hypothetical protein